MVVRGQAHDLGIHPFLGYLQEPGGDFTSACALVRLGVELCWARCNEDSGRVETVQKKNDNICLRAGKKCLTGRGCGAPGFISQTGERWFGHGTL